MSIGQITHVETGFVIGNPDQNPFTNKPTKEQIDSFIKTMIISSSGQRGVFGSNDDDMDPSLVPEKKYVVAKLAIAFADFVIESYKEQCPSSHKPVIAVGLDTRPTGPTIADIMIRVFIAKGIDVRYAFICAAPEIMAWAHFGGTFNFDDEHRLDAFCYISASHNPPGHNGFKFGLDDGAVLTGKQAGILKDKLLANIGNDIDEIIDLVSSVKAKDLEKIFISCSSEKRKSISAYTLFEREVAGCSSIMEEQEKELDTLAASIESRKASVIAEFNGSARCLSIDSNYLEGLGVNLKRINDFPGVFVHRIVPEGQSLEMCRQALENAHEQDPSFIIGYVPDCDGDRGNIVYWNDDKGQALALEAQDTFALAVLSELTSICRKAFMDGKELPKAAVACNDATSLRIEEIAESLGLQVFRSETGEANVVGLARNLREDGWQVRILGEGSNGGVITHPASVRDPLNTITAILKLLYIRSENDIPGMYEFWLKQSNQIDKYHEEFCLCDILESLPKYKSTSVFESCAALKIKSTDKIALKTRYEKLFKENWPSFAKTIEKDLGKLEWKAFSSNGNLERPLDELQTKSGKAPDFGDSGTGGLKIKLTNENGKVVAFLWMRGSGTEPVFRVMADVKTNNPELEKTLLNFHADLVRQADLS